MSNWSNFLVLDTVIVSYSLNLYLFAEFSCLFLLFVFFFFFESEVKPGEQDERLVCAKFLLPAIIICLLTTEVCYGFSGLRHSHDEPSEGLPHPT